MVSKLVRCGLLVVSLVAGVSVWAAARVRDVAPADIQRAVGTNGLALVLLTSPDKGCGYCAGQSQVFDEFAKDYAGTAKLLRVQWSPWRTFPPEVVLLTTMYGLPTWVTFRSGQEVVRNEGRVPNIAKLQELVEQAKDFPTEKQREFERIALQKAEATARPAIETAPPLSVTERIALAAYARIDLIQGALKVCAQKLPQAQAEYDARVADWRLKNKATLDTATKVFFTRTSRQDAAEMSSITNEEKNRLQLVTEKSTGIQAGCEKISALLDQ